MDDAVFAFDTSDHVIYMNAAAERRYGVLAAEVLGRGRHEVFTEAAAGVVDADAPDNGRQRVSAVHRLADGGSIEVESSVSSLKDASGSVIGTLAVMRDVSERRRADMRQGALIRLSDRFRELDETAELEFDAAEIVSEVLGASRVGFGTWDDAGEMLQVRRDWTAPGVQSLAGAVPLREYGSFVDSLKKGEVICIADVRQDVRTAMSAGVLERLGSRSFMNVPLMEQGRLVAVMFVNHAQVRQWSAEEVHLLREVAERTRAVMERARNAAALRASEQRLREANETLEARVQSRTQELQRAEDALRQAQKMEAVGQLTGGIAHDFNNLLASMSASLQVLQRKLAQGKLDGAERYIGIGRDSVRRAAALTQRLLAFARRQTLDPKPTDVNRLVAGMADLIARSVGPNVEVEVVGAASLWPTRVDPSQLENSLLNLCINARDAMQPDGGRVIIETANKWLDERAAEEHDLPVGQYVALSVTDTGSGMAPAVIERVFDPFFTTKPLGQGTGLGLSMVYGFVRQSGGQVRIYSELGRGTTMCLYLPRHVGAAQDEEDASAVAAVETGDGETILVIEDEENIRQLVAEVLQEAGYHVICRADGPSGLAALQSNVRVDLLVTDVGLPGGLNGRQVADQARVDRPELKVLFITGYAENAAVGNGLLAPGMSVMTKPFEVAELAHKVRLMTTE